MKASVKEKESWLEAIDFASNHKTRSLDFSGDAVKIGLHEELSREEHTKLLGYIQEFIPWRKGPLELFGHRIDAGWKSEMKWDRVMRYIDPLEGKLVADIGANNGYYMFRMASQKIGRVVGLDPVPHMHRTFQFLQAFCEEDLPLEYLREGYTALDRYEGQFDVVLCMGILYHHTDPISILRTAKKAMKAGGQLVVESMGIPPAGMVRDEFLEFSTRMKLTEDRRADLAGEPDSVCLFPSGKYAGASGVWFLPTPTALMNMIRRAGFKEVSLVDVHRYEDEQQKTRYSLMPSLTDFLDREKKDRTIEGYPAPVRIHISARK